MTGDARAKVPQEWVDRARAELDALLANPDRAASLPPINLALAEGMRTLGQDLYGQGNFNHALIAATLARAAFEALGEETAALTVHIDVLCIVTHLVSGRDGHIDHRELLHRAAAVARERGLAHQVNRAIMSAADCAYFAAESLLETAAGRIEEVDEGRAFLDLALDDVSEALDTREDDLFVPACITLVTGAYQMYRQSAMPTLHSVERFRAIAVLLGPIVMGDGWRRTDSPEIDPDRVDLLLGYLFLEYGEVDVAVAFTSSTLRTLEATPSLEVLQRLSKAARRRGEYSAELPPLPDSLLDELDHLAVATAEQNRAGFRSVYGRQLVSYHLARQVSDSFRSRLMRRGRHGGSIETFERADGEKAQELRDFLGGHWTEPPSGEAGELEALDLAAGGIGDESWAPDGIAEEESVLTSAVSSPPVPSAEPSALGELEERLAKSDAGFGGTEAAVSLEQITSLLRPGEVLIDLFAPGTGHEPATEIHCAVVSGDGVEWVELSIDYGDDYDVQRLTIDGRRPLDVGPLTQAVANVRTQLQVDQQGVEMLMGCAELFVTPIVTQSTAAREATHWILSPSGVLNLLPWAAMLDSDGIPLGERVELTLTPSASVWVAMVSREREPIDRALVVAASNLPGREVLTLADEEADAVRGLLGQLEVDHLSGTAATESAFRREVPNAGIVHIVAHGTFPGDRPDHRHALVLAADDDADGLVRAWELRQLDLRRARLVFLNICSGGTVRFGAPDDTLGLLPAALAAGAENVLTTLWPIRDEAGHRFAVAFYTALPGRAPAAALGIAMQSLRESGAPPHDWAAFMLCGTGRRLDGS